MNDDVSALRRAVEASPDAVALRLLLARTLIARGDGLEAAEHAAHVLNLDPTNAQAADLLSSALGVPPAEAEAPRLDDGVAPSSTPDAGGATAFDWGAAEDQFSSGPGEGVERLYGQLPEIETLRLVDVGGLTDVKARLEASFLAPLRNPELRRMYRKSLKGGLLLYGPPGCGKTYLARAVAGEMGARFLSVTIADVLSPFFGQSENNLHQLFLTARLISPVVLFLDEIDAMGGRRTPGTGTHSSVTNQLLQELDGVGTDNEGVYGIAATNRPWEVDGALRRPGRFDRLLLVSPPDAEARAAIFAHHLADRPTDRVDVVALAKGTDGLSGADIAAAVESAFENVLIEAVRTGRPRPVGTADIHTSLRGIRPSTRSWFDAARTVVEYDEAGDFGDLKTYMRSRRLL